MFKNTKYKLPDILLFNIALFTNNVLIEEYDLKLISKYLMIQDYNLLK